MAIVGISTAIIDIRAMDHATGSLRGIASNISQVGRAISGAGLAMTASFTIPMVAAGVASIKLATEFDKSMRNIQAIGKQTDSEIATLGQRFITQSQDITKTTASAQELADAFYYVQSSGQSGQDALNIIDSAAKGATAGLSDVQSVAKSLTSIINSYGMQSSEAATLTDMLVRSVDIGVFTFEDINSQIGDFINTASLMKIPLEQVLAVMTAVTKKGIPVSEAATSLNQMLVAYLKPSKEAVAVAKEFGIELSASTIEALGFAGALQDMYNKTGGSEEAMAQIFRNIRSFRGVAALASDGLKSYNQDVITLANSAGTTDKVFATATKSWDAILKNFKNTITNTGIAIGTILLPMLTQLAAGIGRLAEAFSKLSPETQASIVKFAIAFAAFGPVLIIIGQLINAIGILIGVFTGVTIIPAAITAIGTAIALAAGAMVLWNNNTLGIADKLQKLADSGTPVAGVFKAILLELNNLKSAGFFDDRSPLLDQLMGVNVNTDKIELMARGIHGISKEVIMARSFIELLTNAISYLGILGSKVISILRVEFANLVGRIEKTGNILNAVFNANGSGKEIAAGIRSALADYEAFNKNAMEERALMSAAMPAFGADEDYAKFFAEQTKILDKRDKYLEAIGSDIPGRESPINPIDKLLRGDLGGSVKDLGMIGFSAGGIVDGFKTYVTSPMEDGAAILYSTMKYSAIQIANSSDSIARSLGVAGKSSAAIASSPYSKSIFSGMFGPVPVKQLGATYKLVDTKLNPALEDYVDGVDQSTITTKTVTADWTQLGKSMVSSAAKSYEITNGKLNPAMEDLAKVGAAVGKSLTPVTSQLRPEEEVLAILKGLQTDADGTGNSLNKLTTAANPLVDAFNSIFQAAAQASKNLMDLTGAPGAGGVTPGANGPFEDIYRLQAWIKDKTHGDIAAKAGVTTDEQAKSIVGAFQNNNWAPALAADLINIPALQAMGQAQMASAGMGTEGQYGASNLAALQAAGLTAAQASAVAPGVKPVTTTQQVGGGGGAAPGVQTAPDMAKVAKQMSDDADKNAKAIGEAGAKVFGIWEGGFFGAADKSSLMVSLVDRLVQGAIAQYLPKDKK